jgi:pimeloyl-ACP methyl ester carboxylesterase
MGEALAGTVTTEGSTPVAYWRSGEGPLLVLVHGSAADHNRWKPVLPALEERFTVYAVDRRGRGRSGDSDDYLLTGHLDTRIVEHQLPNAPGEHRALECQQAPVGVAKQVHRLPEGVRHRCHVLELPSDLVYPHEVVERMDALLGGGDRDGVVETTMREVAGLPPEAVEHMRSQTAWQARMDAAHTIPRELRAVKAYRFDHERFRNLETPTLMLAGGDSPVALRKAAEAVDEALPNSHLVVMEGQGHAAMDTGTDLFTAEVLRFLTAG